MKLLVICGATASGKTKLAIDCALKLNTEIISADSQLVYRGLNIGTAKPTVSEMRGVKHHLVDIAEPNENYSVSDYMNSAEPIIENLLADNKTPIICGGTGFYINSLLFDYSYGKVGADNEVRVKYDRLLKEKGKSYLYDLLKEKDLPTAEKLHENDIKRVIRALEIFDVSGRRKSDINDCGKVKREYCAVAVNYPREELYERIDRRVDLMFECGLVEEVEGLLNSGIDEDCQCMQAIGYKEVLQGLKNEDLKSNMRDIIKQNTRRYAKRQVTFFKKLPNLVWLNPDEANAENVLRLMNEE